MKAMKTIEETTKLIKEGHKLFLAGDENSLKSLPQGDWIAGTIPYFMTEEGGVTNESLIHVTLLPRQIESVKIVEYAENNLHRIPDNYFENGMSFIIIPAFSDTHFKFAKDCSQWKGVFNQPLVGWISGFNLSNKGQKTKVVNGKTGSFSENSAVIIHASLEKSYVANTNIINLFSQGKGDEIIFDESGFEAQYAIINGEKTLLSNYLVDHKVDLKLPLVADYMGAQVNVSFMENNLEKKNVKFYAPVFEGVTYKIAQPIGKYEEEFTTAIKKIDIKNSIFSCNCVLNYLYADLEGKRIGNVSCPMTFGEIAYMLLNQTFVYTTLDKKQ